MKKDPEIALWFNRMSDVDIVAFEKDLATLAGQAPRGWITIQNNPPVVGRIKSNGVAAGGLLVTASTKPDVNENVAVALTNILNSVGRIMMELQRYRDIPVTDNRDPDDHVDPTLDEV